MAVYVIEINGPQNESAIFLPLRQRLRGRWDFSKTHHREKSDEMRSLAVAAPVIPGICVALDTEKRQGVVFDSLAETEQGREVFRRIQQVYERFPAVFDQKIETWPKAEHKLNVDEAKTWAHYMRQLVTDGYATSLKTELPSAEQIARWPGRRLRDPGNTGPQDERLSMWVDVVPEDAEPAVSGKGGK